MQIRPHLLISLSYHLNMIPFNPPALILINKDLVQQIQNVFKKQLNLTEIITGTEFNARLVADPNYPTIIHLNNLRVMVMDDLYNYPVPERSPFDIVLFASHGLVAVEYNKYGNPNITLPIDRVYLTA